jgi:Domain of unknown function (DUF4365)
VRGAKVLGINDIKEELSHAYIHAIASVAGYSFERIKVDRDSVDVVISARGKLDPGSIIHSPKIDVQLKASSTIDPSGVGFTFVLSKKNYDDLRISDTMCPRILIVLALPQDQAEWLSITREQLVAKRGAFWFTLKGMPSTDNETSNTITIPTSNHFDTNCLRNMMIKVSKGEEIGI